MKKIYLARHGESEWNILSKVQGQKDVPLTDKGIVQANSLGNRLIHEEIDKIYASDLIRAYETANIIGKINNVEVVSMKELREINFGIWEGLTNSEIKTRYQKEFNIWMRTPEKLHLTNAESLKELQLRAMRGINNIVRDNSIDNVLIVSHSATLKTIILGLLGIDISYFKNLSLNNVSLSMIEIKTYNNVLKLFNDTNHIKESQ